ncbi:MAG: hypothetical protein ABL893_03565 [Hyphomicrobium sp.]
MSVSSYTTIAASERLAQRSGVPAAAGLAAMLLASAAANAAPAIRTSSANPVPACATPERLTAFLTSRNPQLNPRYRDIARWYKHYGEAWNVRWDYAFYQMILETNALKYRRGDGSRGDVHEKQNNFAGIGATGRGAPGDRFPDIKTGVHAQIQHLVAYSGEMLSQPIAPRTQLVQDSIVEQSRRLRRAVTFGDLARRWAVDRAYAKSIDGVAEQFRDGYCAGVAANAPPVRQAPVPQPAARRNLSAFAPPSGLGGPKPLKLAGPDTLPWTGDAGQQPPPTPSRQTAPQAPATTNKPHSVPPVRTIWSRDGNVTPAAADAPRAAAPAEQSAQADAPVDTAGTPDLPHFKIGPLMPAPSRLGGPVDVLPVAAPAPVARFKQVITEPSLESAPSPNGACRVLAASYGGRKTLLVRASVDGETRYTALTVLDGFEKSMFDTYTKASAPGAEIVGEYATKDQALADARTNCPG